MLDIQNISKTFNPGTVNAKTALSGLSLHLNHGDFVTIIGGNGAGKSTTMNMITGYIAPTEGTVLIDGIDMSQEPEKAKEKARSFPANSNVNLPDIL